MKSEEVAPSRHPDSETGAYSHEEAKGSLTANSELKWRLLFEQAVDGIFVSDGESRFVDVNDAACLMLGYKRRELLALTIAEIVVEEEVPRIASEIERFADGEVAKSEWRFRRKDGSIVIGEVVGRQLPNGHLQGIVRDVTEKKLDKENRDRGEERMRLATQTAGIGVWELNVLTGRIRWDSEMFRIYGIDPTQDGFVDYSAWSGTVLPGELAEQERILQDTINRCGENRREFHIDRRNDQERRLIEAVEIARPDAMGECEWVLGTNQDVTERKQMEERLRASEEFARTVLEASPDCLKVIGADGRLDFVNANGACLLEVDGPTAVIGAPWESLWPAESWPKIERSIEAAKAGQVSAFTAEAPTAKGTPKHWEVSISAIPSQDGQPVRLLAVSRDVTDKIRSDIAIAESEARFRALSDAMPQLAWTAHPDGAIHWYNKGWFSYTGTTPEQMEGWGWQSVHDPEILPSVMVRWQASIASGDPFEMTFPLRGADGLFRLFLTRVMPQKDDQGQVLQWYGTNTDVEDLRRAEDKQGLLLKELDHRVKNLFAVVSGIVAVSARTASTPKELADAIQGRVGALASAHRLVLTGSAPDRCETTLDDLVRTILAPYGSSAQVGEAARFVMEGPHVTIGGDAVTSFALVFYELATNAAKYGAFSAEGGQVMVTWSMGEAGLEINWSESGGPPIEAVPEREGFGSMLARRSVQGQLGGQLDYNWNPDGLVVRLSAAMERLSP